MKKAYVGQQDAPLFDTTLLAKRRFDAKQIFKGDVFRLIAQRLCARLDLLKVPFHNALDLSPYQTPGLSPFLKTQRPQLQIQRFYDENLTSKQQIARCETALSETPFFGDKTFDLILSPLDLHWSNQPAAYLSAIHQALKPGGLFIASFWGGNTLIELRHVLGELDFAHSGHITQRIIPMMRLQDAASLLYQLPFHLPVADHDTLTFCYQSIKSLCRHLQETGEGNALMQPHQPVGQKDFWQKAEAHYRKTYVNVRAFKKTANACCLQDLPATFCLITLAGWRDGPGIPRALNRGSATHHLGKALNNLSFANGTPSSLCAHQRLGALIA
ncbi:MAG: methyltransferase domain-containing protein [Holosporaceae bacterium]